MAKSNSKPKGKSMFRKFWLDVILGTVFIFGLMGLFKSFTAVKIFDVFDPIGQVFEDMEMTDVVFSQLREEPVVDDRVVLVNVGNRSRFEIAMMIDSINQFNPAAIGVDIFFVDPKEEDPIGDSILTASLANVKNLVMVSKLLYNEKTDGFDSLHLTWGPIRGDAELAFANLITGAAKQEDLKMCRTFNPQQMVNGENQEAFAVKLAGVLDRKKADKFLERGLEVEVINYRGNVLDWGATKMGTMFFALDHSEILEPYYNEETGSLERRYFPDIITDKIVILCFMGNYIGDPEAIEDKFFTPINEKFVGRAYADMFGGVVHANIVVQILNEDYIEQITPTQSWILAIIICFLNVLVFSWIYKKIPRWYDGVTKLIQLMELLGILFLMMYVLDSFSLKLDLTIALIVVALVGDALEVYYGVVKNSFSREGRKDLFRVSKI
jgi:CHASE2 domain-containing sensor protein